MKTPLLTLLAASSVLSANPADFTNFVRQTEYDTFVQWDVQVESSGTMRSPGALSDLGSLFELWSVHQSSGEEIALDREFVSEYSPSVSIEFVTGDPYKPVARTRVDQPFSLVVRVEQQASLSGSAGQTYQHLKVVHQGLLYPEGVLSPYELSGESPQFSTEYTLDAGTELVIDFPAATLAATDLTKTEGFETFAIEPAQTNNGHGNNADDADVSNVGKANKDDTSGSVDDETFAGGRYIITSLLEKGFLQVWPIAEASLSGIDPTKTYENVPPIHVGLTDLYPDSRTYLRVYRGGPSTSPANPIDIGSVAAVVRGTIPQNRTMIIEGLDEFLSQSGSYTVEVLHETPFGTDVLSQFYPLVVDFTLDVRGSLYSR